MSPHLGETMDYQVRGDIVYFTTRNGGAVFSAGSIAWCGSLSHNGYDNNVCGQVLRKTNWTNLTITGGEALRKEGGTEPRL